MYPDETSLSSAQLRETRIDRARVVYLEAGQGEPVLLLHGYPQNHLCWRRQIPALARTHRVIAPDWPGFGGSEPASAPPRYEIEVERIGELADALGLERFNLIAHDYGGFIGLGYVLRHPERVMRLALLNTRAHGTFVRSFYRFSLLQRMVSRSAPLRGLARHLPLGRLHHAGFEAERARGCFSPEIEAQYLAWMDTPRGRAYFFRFFAHYHLPVRPELAAGLASIRCPTAIIWGQRDPYIPLQIARELATRIPDAHSTFLPDGGHFVMEHRPEQVSAALCELLDRPCEQAARAGAA
jgi:pimeloyl-ACP methyl ester carboxylesterase